MQSHLAVILSNSQISGCQGPPISETAADGKVAVAAAAAVFVDSSEDDSSAFAAAQFGTPVVGSVPLSCGASVKKLVAAEEADAAVVEDEMKKNSERRMVISVLTTAVGISHSASCSVVHSESGQKIGRS